MKPKATFVCPTYRRVELLEELLFCFLAQEWDNKELLILNDEPLQTLVCDNPMVKIVNWPKRISPIGLKRNLATSMVKEGFIFPVDDDDLYLPHKIKQAICAASPEMGIFKTDLILVDTDPLELVSGRLPSNYMFTHRALVMASGYDIRFKSSDDVRMLNIMDLFMERLGDSCKAVNDPSYVYRYKTTPYHNSMAPGRAHPHENSIRKGIIELTPRKPKINIADVKYTKNKQLRRISEVLGFKEADMDRFRKSIREA